MSAQSVAVRNPVVQLPEYYGEKLLAPRPTSKLENDPLSAVRDCLFSVFTATLHISLGNLTRDTRCRQVSIHTDYCIAKGITL